MWCATSRRRHHLPTTAIPIVDVPITSAQFVRNLRIYIHVDADPMMQTHVQRTVSRCFPALRQLRQIRQLVPEGHSSDAGRSRTGSFTAWLRQQRVNRHTSLSHTPIAVSTECGCKAHLPAEVFWPHHWCIGLSSLAADTRAHRVQDRSVDLQSHEWYSTVISVIIKSLTCLADGLCVLQSPIVWQYQLLNWLRSTAEHFPFSVLKRGTNYRKKSPLRHLCLPFNVASRHSYLENHSRTLLLIDTLVDLVVILSYLGHSKKILLDWLIDWCIVTLSRC